MKASVKLTLTLEQSKDLSKLSNILRQKSQDQEKKLTNKSKPTPNNERNIPMAKPIPIGGKQAILDHWDSLDPDQSLAITPIDSKHKGSTYTEDGIRLTGSKEFIDSILARLKGFLEYDGNGCRLEPTYIQTVERVEETVQVKDEETGKIVTKKKLVPGNLTGSYAFYLRVKSRGNGQGRPRGRKNGTTTERPVKPETTPNPLREVNAGLKLKAKPKNEPSVEPPPKNTPTYSEPLYAIASSFLNENGDIEPEWLEPIADHPIFPMETYDDVCTFDDAIEKIMKQYKLKRKDIHKVEVTVQKNGKLSFEKF
jgi:hypothetical protein